VPPVDLVFAAPSARAPERTLPPLGALLLAVFDAVGASAPRARVLGSTDAGGALDALTDDRGQLLARHLRPGTWRLEVSSGADESGSLTVELAAGAPTPVQVKLRP
jgi:hypothetical protein